MDINKFNQAVSKFGAFADSLPTSREIQPNYIALYHRLLTDIQTELGQDLSYFKIPQSEMKLESEGDFDEWDEWQQTGTKAVCERAIFLTHLNGAIGFIDTLVAPDKPRAIGFKAK